VTEKDLAGKNAEFTTISDEVRRHVQQDKVITF